MCVVNVWIMNVYMCVSILPAGQKPQEGSCVHPQGVTQCLVWRNEAWGAGADVVMSMSQPRTWWAGTGLGGAGPILRVSH